MSHHDGDPVPSKAAAASAPERDAADSGNKILNSKTISPPVGLTTIRVAQGGGQDENPPFPEQ
jgi:hypothetical protein